MLKVLQSILGTDPQSIERREHQALVQIEVALQKKNLPDLVRALKKIKVPLMEPTDAKVQLLKEGLKCADWIDGFDKVEERLNILASFEAANEMGIKGSPFLLELCHESCNNLVGHLWHRTPATIQNLCLEKSMSLDLATTLARIGRVEQIGPFDCKRVIWSALYSLANQNPEPEQRQRVKEVLRVILKNATPWTNVLFWRDVCLLDNAKVCRELATDKVITEGNLIAELSIASVGDQLGGGSMPKFATKYWDGWNGQHATWNAQAQRKHTFTLTELICIFSTGEFRMLGNLMQKKKFIKELLNSEIAKYALMVSCIESAWGVGVLSELKILGVDLKTLVSENGETPLHLMAASLKIGELATKKEQLIGLMKLCPDWIIQREFNGWLPIELVPIKIVEEATALFESVQLGSVVSGKGGEESGIRNKKLRV